MARRKSDFLVEQGAGLWLEIWCDDELVPKIQGIGGVQSIQHMDSGEWIVWLDPRYDADEVEAEIEALGRKEKPPKDVSVGDEARTLGRAAGSAQWGQIILVVTELLKAAEEVYYNTEAYESALSSLVTDIVERLRQGSW